MSKFSLKNSKWMGVVSCTTLLGGLIPGEAVEPTAARAATTAPGAFDAAEEEYPQSLFQLGPFHFHPRAAASVVYDDNIFISAANRVDDVIWTLSPGLTVGAGGYQGGTTESFLVLDYQPSFIFFTDNTENDAIDHFLQGTGHVQFDKFGVTLSQRYEALSGTEVEVGDRVNRDIYTTRLQTRYDISEKTSVEVNGTLAVRDYRNQIDSTEVSNDNWFNYHITPKVTLGFGATFGYLDVATGPSQTYQQLLLRAIYAATGKVQFNASVGGEIRQFEGSQDDDHNFVFSLGADWQATDSTLVSVEAHRRQYSSTVVVGQNYISTGFSASVRQRLLQRLYLTLAGGYDFSDYEPTIGGFVATREDDYYFLRTAVDYAITRRWTAGVFYQYRDNSSTIPGSEFYNNQVGLQTSVRF